MNSKRALAILALGCMAVFAACEDDGTKPPPPDQPPQIQTVAVYTKSTNDAGKPNGLPGSDVYAFLTLSNGEFWVGTSAGIARYADVNATTRGQDDVVNEINGLPNPKVRAMVEHDGKVYVATWGGGVGVYDIAGDSWSQIVATKNGLRNNSVSDIAVGPDGLIYFATNDAVSVYDPVALTFTSFTGNNLLDELVSCALVFDNAGVIERWFGPRLDEKVLPIALPLHGISVWKSASTYYTYTTGNSGLVEPNVNDLYHDELGDVVWVSYSTKGLAEVDVDAKTWTTHTLVQGLPSNTVYGVTRAAGTMWAATQNGLAKRQNGKWQGYGVSGGLPADRVRVVYSDNGERLWVGFIDGGAVRIKTN